MSNQEKNNPQTLLRVEHLKQYFKMGRSELKAVDDISFEVKKGEVFGIVGESGCGKTTTGRSIIGLYNITGGDVYLGDDLINSGIPGRKQAIKDAGKQGDQAACARLRQDLKVAQKQIRRNQNREVHEKIQMIFQDPVSSLDPRMTVREIIAEGLVIRGEKNKDVINQKVSRVLNLVGLVDEHAERYPHEFSGGQRQRIGIARAIVMEPELIIADEPVSALDVSVQAQVINLLNDLRDEMDLTIIFIAHDLSVVKYFSDRIAVMYYGKIVELADSDELFRHPFHPYTKALLSAIPVPNPRLERKRVRETYIPALAHNYKDEGPSMREVLPEHFVYCNSQEEEAFRLEAGRIDLKPAE